MTKELAIYKNKFFSIKYGKYLLMTLSPLIMFIFMCAYSIVWITALIVIFIAMVCAAPFFVWLWHKEKGPLLEALNERREQNG